MTGFSVREILNWVYDPTNEALQVIDVYNSRVVSTVSDSLYAMKPANPGDGLWLEDVDETHQWEIYGNTDATALLVAYDATPVLQVSYDSNVTTVSGGAVGGDDLILKANSSDARTHLSLKGNSGVDLDLANASGFFVQNAGTDFVVMAIGGSIYTPTVTTKGVSTPSAAWYENMTTLTTGIGHGIHVDADVITTSAPWQISAEYGIDTVESVSDVGGEFNIESTGHGLSTGMRIYLENSGSGDLPAAALGYWVVTAQDVNNITLDGSTYGAGYSTGGGWQEHYRWGQWIESPSNPREGQFVINGDLIAGNAANPSLRIGTAQNGFYVDTVTRMNAVIAGARNLIFVGGGIYFNQTASPYMLNEGATATNPGWAFWADEVTGMGREAAGIGSLIGGGVQCASFSEDAFHTKKYNRTEFITWADCYDTISQAVYADIYDVASWSAGGGTNVITTTASHSTLTTGAIEGNAEGTRSSYATVLRSQLPRYEIEVDLTQTTDTEFYMGYNTETDGKYDQAADEYAMILFDDSADSNWRLVVSDGVGTQTIDSGVAASTSGFVLEIWVEADGTVHWAIDRVEMTASSTRLMTASAHYYGYRVIAEDGGAVIAEVDYTEFEKMKH